MTRRRSTAACAALVAIIAAATASPAAAALERGDSCTLKAPLAITIKQRSGTLESNLEAGTLIEVVGVSDGGSARILAGDVKGDVTTADLESACSGTLRTCRLTAPVMMYEQNRSDSKSWRIKSGAGVSVLKKGATWGAVRVGDLQGFVKTDELDRACVPDAARKEAASEGADTEASEAVERNEGPGVLFLPFTLEGAAPAGNADALLEVLYNRGAYYRPDAARLAGDPDASGARNEPWKTQIALSAKRARGAETQFVIVGRLAMEAPKPDAPLEERHLLQLAAVEAKTGKVLKAIRIRPTTKPGDNWAEKALSSLLPTLPAAPGSKLPVAAEQLELAPVHSDAPPVAPQRSAPVDGDTQSSWAGNPWGWLALGTAAALGAGSGLVGLVALSENTRANETAAADPAQAERRNTALTEAITADALGVVAAGALVTSVIVFATRAGHAE